MHSLQESIRAIRKAAGIRPAPFGGKPGGRTADERAAIAARRRQIQELERLTTTRLQRVRATRLWGRHAAMVRRGQRAAKGLAPFERPPRIFPRKGPGSGTFRVFVQYLHQHPWSTSGELVGALGWLMSAGSVKGFYSKGLRAGWIVRRRSQTKTARHWYDGPPEYVWEYALAGG